MFTFRSGLFHQPTDLGGMIAKQGRGLGGGPGPIGFVPILQTLCASLVLLRIASQQTLTGGHETGVIDR